MKLNSGENKLSPTAQVVVLICLLAALMFGIGIIFLPSYLEFMAYRQQREAVRNLKEIYKAEEVYFARNNCYADTFVELSYSPTGGYTYYLGQEVHENGADKYYPLPKDIRTWAGKSDFQAVAMNNLDEDPDLDIWTVNEKGRIVHVFNDFDRPRLKDYPKEIGRILMKKN